MKTIRLFAIIISIVMICLLFGSASIVSAGDNTIRVLIGFDKAKNGFNHDNTVNVKDHLKDFGGKFRKQFDQSGIISVEIPADALESFRKMPGVSFVEEDGLVYSMEQIVPWGISSIDADAVHSYNTGVGIKVAIIDTGIDLDHEDLYVADDVTFVSGTSTGNDDNGHGTHVAGIVAALDNDLGVIGVAPDVDLYAVKVLNYRGSGYWSDVVEGIEWCIANDIDVINMSLGSTTSSSSLQNACDAAYTAGCLVVAAAGNNGNSSGIGDNVTYPAKYSSVIAVAAIDSSDTRLYFSSTGSAVELSAPGENIYSTYINDAYTTKKGTSMATPHVSGAAALVFASGVTDENSNGRINDEVREILQETAIDLGTSGKDYLYGYGKVDADTAAPHTVNTAPTAPVIHISPENPLASDDLVCVIDTESEDENGDDIDYKYEWYKDDTLAGDLDEDTVDWEYLSKGDDWKCVVTPNDGKVDGPSAEAEITVLNSPPVADAGEDQTAFVGDTIYLDGSGSEDFDDDSLGYTWTQSSGVSVTLFNSSSDAPYFTAAAEGEYEFSLVVNDSEDDSESDEVTVSVEKPNTPPVLSSGYVDKSEGSASTVFNYHITYQDDDNNSPDEIYLIIDNDDSVKFALEPGDTDDNYIDGADFTVSLTGSDLGLEGDNGTSGHSFRFYASDKHDDAVNNGILYLGPTINNSAPSAPAIHIEPDEAYTTTDLSCVIETASTDPDGDPVLYNYQWYRNGSSIDGLDSDSIDAGNTNKGEEWKCEVTATDGLEFTSVFSDTVTIDNSAPVADAGTDQTVSIYTTVTLSGESSYDADQDNLTYTWLQTAGPQSVSLEDSATASPSFIPQVIGTYTFSLRVNDGKEYSGIDYVSIEVENPPTPTLIIDSIDMTLFQIYYGWRTYARATVTVVDFYGDPVEDVYIEGHWESATTNVVSGYTDSDGQLNMFSNSRLRPRSGTTFIFEIDSISKDGYVWNEILSVTTGSVSVP